MTHLGEDGGFWAAENADPGAGSGDQSACPSRGADSGHCAAAWLFAQYGEALSERRECGALRGAVAAADQARCVQGLRTRAHRGGAAALDSAAVLHRELRERGYTGGVTQLKMLIAPYKRIEEEPVIRFETPPGQQMQADFTHVRRGRQPLLAFVATLGYSRASYVRFTSDETAATLCRCVREALIYFGGVPGHVLFDNASTIVVERDAYGEGRHRWHRLLRELAGEYGFGIRLCRPYRAKTKGKVERFNSYLKGSFLVPLAATLKQSALKLDVEAANAHIGRWINEVANCRLHATTRERPDRRLVIERAALLPLPNELGPTPRSAPPSVQPMPIESLQHPLAVYDELLEIQA
jgi:transposase